MVHKTFFYIASVIAWSLFIVFGALALAWWSIPTFLHSLVALGLAIIFLVVAVKSNDS